MRKTITLLVILCFSFCSRIAWACPPPEMPFRVLAEEATHIIGVQLNQMADEKQIPIHQLLKGKHTGATIEMDYVPWKLRLDDLTAVYAIAFVYHSDDYGFHSISADNNVLLFNTMDEAEYAMKRFRELVAIQNRGNHDREVIEWLAKSIELELAPEAPEGSWEQSYPTSITKNNWFHDAIWDLSDWKFKKDKIEEDAAVDWDFGMVSWSSGDLDQITETQKERIFKVFRNTATPDENFLHIVTYLGIENVESQLFSILYHTLETEKRYLASSYIQALTQLELSNPQQEYLSKLILYYHKAIILPIVLKNTKGVVNWEFKDDFCQYIADYTQSEPLITSSKEWVGEKTDWGFIGGLREVVHFEQLMNQMEKHLNMCDDWRISQLTGKQKLWTCTEESAFAQAKSFDEESIDVQVFPNPSNGNFNIKLKLEKDAPVIVDVLSIDGKSIVQQQLTKEEGLQYHFQGKFELEGLATGIYFVQIRQQNKVYVQKIIVE